MAQGKTLFDKIWDAHLVATLEDGSSLIHVDRHLIHEISSPKAFDDLRASGRKVHSPELTIAVEDHIPATDPGRDENTFDKGIPFLENLRKNTRDFGISLIKVGDADQGITHIIGPQLGLTIPGATVACGDSHTCTNGGLGAMALAVGATDIGHVLATQTVALQRPKTFRINIEGQLGPWVFAKDVILYLIHRLGVKAGIGYAVEYAGSAIRSLPVEGRLTLCNMSVELGARVGMVAPDEVTYEYLAGKRYAPAGTEWDRALAHWRSLPSDPDARFDREVTVDAGAIGPQITWGTNPGHAISVGEQVPRPEDTADADERDTMVKALRYMDVEPGASIEDLPIDQVFIGSCTNSRLSDLRIAAEVARGRRVPDGIRAMVVPGSTLVRWQAESEGLDKVFLAAGFEWHESGCSMCAAQNGDFVPPFKRCVSTTNRNFESRQGRDARTHLASPAMAAACAVSGRITDVRKLMGA